MSKRQPVFLRGAKGGSPPRPQALRGLPDGETFQPPSGPRRQTVLVVDHYDSFTYNLVQLCLQLGAVVHVRRSDKSGLAELLALGATHWLMSPGPGHPADAGIRPEIWRAALTGGTPPVLGVCLGHQGLCLALGARIVTARRIMHGKRSVLDHDGRGLFDGCSPGMQVVRYHSLVVDADTLPPVLQACASAGQGEHRELMAVRHRTRPLFGVQFHPESVATTQGQRVLENFLQVESTPQA